MYIDVYEVRQFYLAEVCSSEVIVREKACVDALADGAHVRRGAIPQLFGDIPARLFGEITARVVRVQLSMCTEGVAGRLF